MHRLILIFTTLAALILLSSCKETAVTPGKPKINAISVNEAMPGDTVELAGVNFGYNAHNSGLLFDNGYFLEYFKCIKWNNNLIKFEVTKNVQSGSLAVVVNGDTSNKTELKITLLPSFSFVEIKPDSFYMGSQSGLRPEVPVHLVHLTKGFFISKFEVNQRLWTAVMDTNPSIAIGRNMPVNNISWLDAVRFCNAYSAKTGLKPVYTINNDTVTIDTNGNGYRLPTEAEWEYCCRAGSTGDFAGAGSLGDIGWYNFNSGLRLHEPGQKSPNAFGIFDMSGNVWEWCWDWFDEYYYYLGQNYDPPGPKSGQRHVVRGGSFADGETYCRSACRTYPYTENAHCGIRLVKIKN